MLNKIFPVAALASGLVLGAFAAPVHADVPATETGLTAVGRFHTAMELAAWGREREDAVALLAAARIVITDRRLPQAIDGPEQAIGDAEKPGTNTGPQTKAEHETVDLLSGLFADARRYALGDEGLLTMVAETEQSASRESVSGKGHWDARISARKKQSFHETYYGGRMAEASVAGDGDTDVDLYVFDENGNEVCRSVGSTDREYCQWTPARTARYEIVVGNFGHVYNDVVVRTN